MLWSCPESTLNCSSQCRPDWTAKPKCRAICQDPPRPWTAGSTLLTRTLCGNRTFPVPQTKTELYRVCRDYERSPGGGRGGLGQRDTDSEAEEFWVHLKAHRGKWVSSRPAVPAGKLISLELLSMANCSYNVPATSAPWTHACGWKSNYRNAAAMSRCSWPCGLMSV